MLMINLLIYQIRKKVLFRGDEKKADLMVFLCA